MEESNVLDLDRYIFDKVVKVLNIKPKTISKEELRVFLGEEIFDKMFTLLLFRNVKIKSQREMPLFCDGNVNLEDYGFLYCGELDISGFAFDIRRALDFNCHDFLFKVVKSEPLNTFKQIKGNIYKFSRDEEWVKTNIRIVKGKVYDSFVSPDTIIGRLIKDKHIEKFVNWILHLAESYNFIKD